MKKVFILLMSLFALMAASLGLRAQEITITLNPGWNWISYPNATAMEIDDALDGFTPIEGDIIKSQLTNTSYHSGQWRGRLTQFDPGSGYHYYSARTEVTSFVFAQAYNVSLTTAVPTDITATSAIAGGTVTVSEGIHVFLRGVCWGTDPNPDYDGIHTTEETGVGSFTCTPFENLIPGTTYYVRAYAVTDYGLAYGEERSFTTLIEEVDNHEYIDLGLPSGTLWATCNIGAETPEDYGDYFAWGEIQPKDYYDWNTYQYCNGSGNTLTKYCNDSEYGYNGFTDNLTTLLPEDDAATANWGGDWRMPTYEEWQELYLSTTCIWTTQNGVSGRLFTADNGNSLFLPAGGYRYGGILYSVGTCGDYHSSLLDTDLGSPEGAWSFDFYPEDNYYGMSSYVRCAGNSVRAVRSSVQNSVPTGAIDGKFTINDNGDQVYFSQGNLQYIGSASTPYWKFAANQWDYYGETTGQNSSDQNVNRDLFGWGTSGWHNINDPYNVNYQPWSTTSNGGISEDYNNLGYGPSTNMPSPNLTGSSANYDWGVYNPIFNGGNQPYQWRTLTDQEWRYIINTRTTASGIRYASAIVNNVNGVILLPDDWSASTYTLNNTNELLASFSSNTISASQWDTLEQHGAVFLPAAGRRIDTSLFVAGSEGYYWFASYNNSTYALGTAFHDSGPGSYIGVRCVGASVRLVHNVQ